MTSPRDTILWLFQEIQTCDFSKRYKTVVPLRYTNLWLSDAPASVDLPDMYPKHKTIHFSTECNYSTVNIQLCFIEHLLQVPKTKDTRHTRSLPVGHFQFYRPLEVWFLWWMLREMTPPVVCLVLGAAAGTRMLNHLLEAATDKKRHAETFTKRHYHHHHLTFVVRTYSTTILRDL